MPAATSIGFTGVAFLRIGFVPFGLLEGAWVPAGLVALMRNVWLHAKQAAP